MKVSRRCITVVAIVTIILAGIEAGAAGKTPKKGMKKLSGTRSSEVLVPLSFEQLVTPAGTLPVPDGKDLVLTYSPDGSKMAAGGEDKSLTVWEARSGKMLWSIKETPEKISRLCFSGDGALLAAAGRDKEIFLWDGAKGALVGSVRVKDDVRGLGCNRHIIAAALDDKSIVLLDMNKMKEANSASAGEAKSEGDFSRWFKLFKNSKKEQEEAIFEKSLVRILRQEREEPLSLAFSPDGTLLATGSKNKRVVLWDVNKGTVAKYLEGVEKETTRLAFNSLGTRLAAVEDKRRVALWDLGEPARPYVIKPEKDDIIALAFNNDGNILAIGDKKRLALWSVRNPREMYQFPEQEKELTSVQFSADGKGMAVAEEKQIKLWNVPGILNIVAAPSGAEDTAALEREREVRIGALKSSKGEFETTRDYEARLKRVKAEEAAIKRDYEKRIRTAAARRKEELALMQKRLYPYMVSGELGNYDADKGAFAARVGDRQVSIMVPAAQAKRFAQHRDKVSFTGMIRYHGKDKAELVNAALLDQESGARFPFGIQIAGPSIAEAAPTRLSAGQHPALPKLQISTVSFAESSGYGSLGAGDNGVIRVAIRNSGSGAAEVVLGIQSAAGTTPNGIRFADKVYVGRLGPDETKKVEVDIAAGEEAPAQDVRLQLTALDENGFDSRPVDLAFSTRALFPPELKITKMDIRDADGGRVLTKGKEVDITAVVHNGGGMARNVRAAIEIGDMNIKLFSDQEVTLGNLGPNDTKKVTFTIAVTQRYSGDTKLPVDIVLQEERPRFSARLPVRLTLNEEAPDIRLVRVEAREIPRPGPTSVDDDRLPLLVPAQRTFGENDVAIVIGIERYQSVPRSDFSNNDARSMKSYLLSLGFAERNIELLTDDRASLSAIRKSVESWLPNRIKSGARAFFFYSGHGAPDPATGEAFLVPYDGDPGYLKDTGYPVNRLYEKLGKSGARETIVVIDSCFSGTGGRSIIAKGARPLVMMAEGHAIPAGVAVLSSTHGAQISTSYPEKEHGMFTWFFLKALREGKSDLAEIYSYVKPLVEDAAKRQNVEQSPTITPDPQKLSGKFLVRK